MSFLIYLLIEMDLFAILAVTICMVARPRVPGRARGGPIGPCSWTRSQEALRACISSS